ncbi:hypothetical protein AB0D10_31520 [Kitasatospora sp. NPDC048545]|uniref:hypothetical protein n=1 Tax=Kitasatospora sp. NPDC048545 TaxID=3157208 RepID=UPI0033D8315C
MPSGPDHKLPTHSGCAPALAKLQHDDSFDVIAYAECRDGSGVCAWDSGDPALLDELAVDIAEHCRETGHARFLRTVTHHVTVESSDPPT